MGVTLTWYYSFVILFANQQMLRAKMDIGVLLFIESSVQNNDFDILCTLKETMLRFMQRNGTSTEDAEFDLALSYIDWLLVHNHLYRCGSSPLTAEKTSKVPDTTNSSDDLSVETGKLVHLLHTYIYFIY